MPHFISANFKVAILSGLKNALTTCPVQKGESSPLELSSKAKYEIVVSSKSFFILRPAQFPCNIVRFSSIEVFSKTSFQN